jgi:signal peptidase II
MTSRSRYLTIAGVLSGSIAADQLLKIAATAFLRFAMPLSYFGDFIRFEYAENSGVMLSVGASLSPAMRFWIFVVAIGIVLLAMLLYVIRSRELDRFQVVAWSLIISGGMGNLLDRLLKNGVVVDYISVGFHLLRTAVFNFADVVVFVGVFLVLVHRTKSHHGAPAELTGNADISGQ